MIGAAIFARLSGDAAVTALAGTRVYPMRAPEGVTAPFVIYQITGLRPTRVLVGPATTAAPRLQLDAYATSYAGAQQLAEAIRHCLDGWSEASIQACSLTDWRDFGDFTDDPTLYRINLAFDLFTDLAD